jgi:acetamidase/formamidase
MIQRMTEHTVDPTQIHHSWDNSLEPVLVVEPGDVVRFDLPMTGEGQVSESSTMAPSSSRGRSRATRSRWRS